MRELLEQIDWESIICPLDIHTAWQTFSSLFTATLNSCIPFSTPRPKKNNIYMTRRGLCLKNKKCKLWHKFISTDSPSDYKSYCQARNELRKLTRSLRESYERRLASNRKIDVKHFWKYVNSRLKIRPTINSLYRDDNSVTYSDQEKCELFNHYFSSVFTNEDCSTIPSFQLSRDIADIDIAPAMVLDKLMHLDPSKSSGPEGWPIVSLKEMAQQLCAPLCILYKKSFESSILPNTWKEAFVTPIHKKGDRSSVKNYRPISLTSPIVKILESIIEDSIQEHLISNNLILPNQHGFTAGRSCATQLLTAINYWTKTLEDGHSIDVLYFDFAKAFDSVPHNRLIAKLQGLGITGRLLSWLKNFLVNRKQKVVLNTCSSSWSNVKSGVYRKAQF